MGEIYVYRCVFIAQTSFLISATSVTWSSPILAKLDDLVDNPLGRKITSTENSWLASLLVVGAALGSLLCGIATSKFGRKTILIACGFPFLVFNLVLAWATNIWFFYLSRLCTGIGLGSVFTLLPIYSGEIARAKNRGILGASMTVFINIGLLIPYCVGPYIPFFWFHIILASLAAIYMPLFYFFAPETPHFLIRNNPEKARFVLENIREISDVDKDLKEIEASLENNTEGSLLDVFKTKSMRKAFIIGFGMVTFMQLTCAGVVAAYTQTIFKDAGGDISADLCPIIIGVTQLIATVVISAIADSFPRKVLLITSHLGVALTEIPFGLYFYLKREGNDVTNISFLPLICLIFYVIIYNIGVGPLVYTSLAELFPLEIKGKVVSFLIFYHWILSFIFTFLYNNLKESIGLGVFFWISSFTGFLAAIFIKILMVETRGKTFEEIQAKLKNTS